MKSKRTLVLTIVVLLAAASLQAAPDSGTKLSIVGSSSEAAQCNQDGTRTVSFDWNAVSTAAADSATVTAAINGGVESTVGSILSGIVPGGWTNSGRTKTAAGSFDLNLAPGDYTITICITQHGSGGNPDKRACTTVHVTVTACTEAGCPGGDNEARGQLTADENSFCGSDHPMSIHFHGNFGDNPTVTINEDGNDIDTLSSRFDDPDTESVGIHSGGSCEYIAQWRGHTRACGSTYVFTINGNSQTASATATCNHATAAQKCQ